MIKRFNEFLNESNNADNINKIIDFTVIKPNTTKEDIVTAIETIRNNHYYGIVLCMDFFQ
jgi:deoxyribose-phosphate aldolase